MGQVVALEDLNIHACDVTGQRRGPSRVPRDATVGEWVQRVVGELGLKRKDRAGNPYTYRARRERDGRHLNPSEIAREALQDDDHVVLQPNVDAG